MDAHRCGSHGDSMPVAHASFRILVRYRYPRVRAQPNGGSLWDRSADPTAAKPCESASDYTARAGNFTDGPRGADLDHSTSEYFRRAARLSSTDRAYRANCADACGASERSTVTGFNHA